MFHNTGPISESPFEGLINIVVIFRIIWNKKFVIVDPPDVGNLLKSGMEICIYCGYMYVTTVQIDCFSQPFAFTKKVTIK